MSPSVQWLHHGRKLHLQHGPIDLIIEVAGSNSVVERAAYQRAIDRFETVLTELVSELPILRTQTNHARCCFEGSIARRMWQAASGCGQVCCQSSAFYNGGTTPMIAVAGSVADEILDAIMGNADDAKSINKVSVNNGGDIAIYLNANSGYRVGVVANPDDAEISASLTLRQADGIGGIATSGWRGRSFSLGIADSVTVLASNAATADAAATLIANAVTFESSAGGDPSDFIERQSAKELDPDTDLGNAQVTTNVWPLPPILIGRALDAGCEVAAWLEQQALISGACLCLQGGSRVVGDTCDPILGQLGAVMGADRSVLAMSNPIGQPAHSPSKSTLSTGACINARNQDTQNGSHRRGGMA